MKKLTIPILSSLVAGAALLPSLARGETAVDPVPAEDPADHVVIAGNVTSVSDSDGDGKNDTFVIGTGGGNEKTVSNVTEMDDMALIETGDHVEIKVKVTGAGLKIVDVVKIGA